MDINTVSQLIGTVGFPVVMCILMFYSMSKQDELHKEEIDKLRESLNNNTAAVNALVERLGVKENG